MNRLVAIAFSSVTVVGTLVGCASAPKSSDASYHPANTAQTNAVGNTRQPTKSPSGSSKDTTTDHKMNSSAPSSGSNSVTSKTATNTTGVTSPPPTNAVQFSAYIASAMDQVKQTTKGPVLFAPTAPTFHPSVQFIGVQESASEDEYTVRLFSSSSSVPLNDPTLNHLSASSLLGMFSGRYYPSHNTAMNELNEQFDVKKVGAPVDTNGVMKEYSTGQSYSTGTLANSDYPQHVMEWQEGKWTIDVFGAPSLDFLHDAEQVDSFLQSHALPPTDGRVLINPDVTGTPIAQIGWVFGNTLYQCEAPLTSSTRWNALQMAVSMREYDNYKVEP